ncbi:putative 2OG-Fe(II) oxygenase [Achromobacter spanius]|uniref:putative 2OG-Fe(II) oxygenase n=1 Tax=Achromobacter spanius TaxID=217203 RepID=UPI0012FE23E7|nr:putative 2OG-Fe(II) oxygenase [Achromobacter spanius]
MHYNLRDSGQVGTDLHEALQIYSGRNQDRLLNDEKRSATLATLYTRYDTGVFKRTRNPRLTAIRDLLLAECDHYAEEVYSKLILQAKRHHTMWFVVQRSGQAKDAVHAHYHEGSDLAFVYYLTMPKDGSGQLALMDPRGPIGRGGFAVPRHPLVSIIQPREGDLIMFPRYLMHYTTPNTDNITRRVIAGSVKYERTA